MHGSLARYVDHPADFCFKLPDSLSYEQGAMVEPLSNAGLFLVTVEPGLATMESRFVARKYLPC